MTLLSAGDDLRLRRLTCGKASPFRWTPEKYNLCLAGWEAKPPSQRGGGPKLQNRPESRRLSASQAAEPLETAMQAANLTAVGYSLSALRAWDAGWLKRCGNSRAQSFARRRPRGVHET